jgi:hypothetical protein
MRRVFPPRIPSALDFSPPPEWIETADQNRHAIVTAITATKMSTPTINTEIVSRGMGGPPKSRRSQLDDRGALLTIMRGNLSHEEQSIRASVHRSSIA